MKSTTVQRSHEVPVAACVLWCTFTLIGAGCDPIIEVDGAFFPAWLVCMIAAGFLLGLIRWAAFKSGIEKYIGPRVLIYFCVYLSCTLALWLGFFRT